MWKADQAPQIRNREFSLSDVRLRVCAELEGPGLRWRSYRWLVIVDDLIGRDPEAPRKGHGWFVLLRRGGHNHSHAA